MRYVRWTRQNDSSLPVAEAMHAPICAAVHTFQKMDNGEKFERQSSDKSSMLLPSESSSTSVHVRRTLLVQIDIESTSQSDRSTTCCHDRTSLFDDLSNVQTCIFCVFKILLRIEDLGGNYPAITDAATHRAWQCFRRLGLR